MNKWAHIFHAFARHNLEFLVHHSILVEKHGLVFRTALSIRGGYLFRQMFAVLPDGRIFGPRNREVDECILLAWMNDPQGLNDFC